MIIAPLVFATLVAGIAHMEDAAAIGRVGAKTMGWFIGASIVSLSIGLVMVHLLQPGSSLALALPTGDAAGVVARSAEHTSELQSLMRNSYAVFCLKKKHHCSNIRSMQGQTV